MAIACFSPISAQQGNEGDSITVLPQHNADTTNGTALQTHPKGDADVQLDIEHLIETGLLYIEGDSVPKNYEKAAEWFEKSAQQNCPEALCNLATCYYNGYGVKQDGKKAFKICLQAAAQSNPGAMEAVEILI